MTLDRLIFLGLIVVLAIPFVHVLGIPIPISPETRKYHQAIIGLPKGCNVLWVTDIDFTLWVEIQGGEIATMKMLFKLMKERQIHLVWTTTGGDTGLPDGRILIHRMIDEYLRPGGFLEGLKYGEDYVLLGWLPGWETSLRGLVTDIHKLAPTDDFGTPIDQIPLMKGIHSGKDFALLGYSSYYVDQYMRQWSDQKVPIIADLSASAVSFAKPWFAKGFVSAYLGGAAACAEIEQLSGYPGPAAAAMDAQILGHIAAVVVLVVPNLYWLTIGRKRGK